MLEHVKENEPRELIIPEQMTRLDDEIATLIDDIERFKKRLSFVSRADDVLEDANELKESSIEHPVLGGRLQSARLNIVVARRILGLLLNLLEV